VSADGTFSIVLVKHNIRAPRAARSWFEIIVAAGKKISNEQRRILQGNSSNSVRCRGGRSFLALHN
jgi:hypothetical protein